MAGSSLILGTLRAALQKFEAAVLSSVFGRPFPPPAVCFDESTSPHVNRSSNRFSLKDIIGDGFLYAVPKSRRTIEKRLNRKFGNPKYVWKLLVPKTNLKACNTCGHDYDSSRLCPNCYNKIKKETQEMQEKIEAELGLNPIEQDVIVLYEGETLEEPEEFWKGKRIIEMKKPRPSWFSKNLLQKTTQQPATTTDVKPTDLS